MKVLIFLEHDVICRNFVMSGALAALVRSAEVKFVFPDDGGKRMKLDPALLQLGAPYMRLPSNAERQLTWRWMLFAQQLRWGRGDQEAAIRKFRYRALGWKASLLLTLANLPIGDWIFRGLIKKRLRDHADSALGDLLDGESPDVVLHPSVLESVFMNDLVVACGARNIPLVVAMNSWDNPSTKRAVVGKPDLLLVWGPQTHAHALRFMAQPEAGIEEFGAAQFDIFRAPPRLSRSDYCDSLGLAATNRLVLFAGSNAQTDEIAALDAIDKAIDEGRLDNTSVIYRPHPWGGGGQRGERLATASWRHITIDPTMRGYIESLSSNRAQITLPDARDTHDLLCLVDAVVSPLSTILLEAMLHGKLPIALVPQDGGTSGMASTHLPFLHFQEFLRDPAVKVARSNTALLDILAGELAGEQQGLLHAARHFVRPFDQPWSERLVARLSALVASRKAEDH